MLSKNVWGQYIYYFHDYKFHFVVTDEDMMTFSSFTKKYFVKLTRKSEKNK